MKKTLYIIAALLFAAGFMLTCSEGNIFINILGLFFLGLAVAIALFLERGK